MNQSFSHLSISFLFLFVCISINAQPQWLDADYRDLNYPSSAYYCALGEARYDAYSDMDKVAEGLKQRLQLQIASEIKVKVSGTQENKMNQTGGRLSSSHNQTITSSTEIEITGVTFESYKKEKKEILYAFAYVSKDELKTYYKSYIGIQIKEAQSHIALAKELVAQSEHGQAKIECQEAILLTDKAKQYQDVLIALDKSNGTIYKTEINDLITELRLVQMAMKQTATFYIQCDANSFGVPNSSLESKIKAQLADAGWRFVNNRNQAVWTVSIRASARRHNKISQNLYISYVDADVSLTNIKQKQEIYKNNLSDKDGGTNYADAALRAYSALATKIATELINNLN